jgi:hypothetical protein
MPDWTEPFARAIDAAKKYCRVIDLEPRRLERGTYPRGSGTGDSAIKAGAGEGAVHGHGPTLFAGLSKRVDLKLVDRLEFASGAVAMRYEPRR